jgi:hypothetical protein
MRSSLRLAGSYSYRMNLEFSGEMWFWKGPAPWHFVTVPDEECGELDVAFPQHQRPIGLAA